jgi:hypothetical protein
VHRLGCAGRPAGQLAVDRRRFRENPAAEAWLAVVRAQSGESQVRAGENAGKTLRHDYVVRRLIGPLAPDRRVASPAANRSPLAKPTGKRADLGVVAVFVQDKATRRDCAGLQRHACPG